MVSNISCIILTKNSEKTISMVLEKIYEHFKEIVIVDDESHDRTIDIIKKIDKQNKIKLCIKKLIAFDQQRNFASSLATNKWVLHLDSDEIPDNTLINELYKIDKEVESSNLLAYKIKGRTYFGIIYIGDGEWIRLFNKQELSFIGAVHEVLVVSSDKVGKLKGYFEHYSYMNMDDFYRKITSYLVFERQKIVKNKIGLYKVLKKFIKDFIIQLKILFKNIYFNKSILKGCLWFILIIAYDLLILAEYINLKFNNKKFSQNN